MKKRINRLIAAGMALMLAIGSTGCSAEGIADDILQKIEDLRSRFGLSGDDSKSSAEGSTAGATSEMAAQEEPEALSQEEEIRRSEGKVLNICCWDESLEDLFLQYYPGYEDAGDRVGRIGETTINWVIPPEGKKYMDFLAERLLTAEYLDKDDKIDLYLAPEDDLSIYVNSDYSLDVREKVGMTDEELEDQFAFTQQMASTDDGILKAVTWQASPGVFIYRRSIAKKVLGSDDPDAVQKALETWKQFDATAVKMKKKKFFMVSGYYDTYPAYRFTSDRHWEQKGKLVIPSAFMDWYEQTKLYTKKGYNKKTLIGDEGWVADQGPGSKVFGFFRAITDIDSKMAAYSLEDIDAAPEEGNGIYGDFAVCPGPQSFCRGGVWILASPSTDNLILDREIMENLTCSSSLLYKIAQKENIFTNTVSGMEKMAKSGISDDFLGGQNPYEVYFEAASRLSMLPASNYDRWIADTFRSSMRYYFNKEKTEDEAFEYFYAEVKERYPELDVDPDTAIEKKPEAAEKKEEAPASKEEAPATKKEEAPASEKEEAPASEQEEAPASETEEAPASEKEAPVSETVIKTEKEEPVSETAAKAEEETTTEGD